MRCQQCQHDNAPEQNFCGRCGQKLTPSDATLGPPPTGPPPGPPSDGGPLSGTTVSIPPVPSTPPKLTKEVSQRTFRVVAGLIGLVTVAVVVILLRSGGDDTADPGATTTTSVAPTTTVELSDYSDDQIASLFGDAIWKVEVDGCDFEGSGSAFAIDRTHLVTNFHVVAVDMTPTIISRDGETTHEARVVAMSDKPDIAILEIEVGVLDPILDWADTATLVEGQHLVVMGYPTPGTDFSVTPGAIVSFEVDDGIREVIRTDGAIDTGNSGGPALTSNGQVAGVATRLDLNLEGFQIVGEIVTYEALQETLDELLKARDEPERDCTIGGMIIEPNEDWFSFAFGELDEDYGDDEVLDALWEICDSNGGLACDKLYVVSPPFSGYETHGESCGGRGFAPQGCAAAAGQAPLPLSFDAPAGTCLVLPRGQYGAVPVAVDCAQEHDAEVIHVMNFHDFGDYWDAFDDSFNRAFDECDAAFEGYIGEDTRDSDFVLDHYFPEIAAWELEDDTTGECFVLERGHVLEGSVRDSGR